MKKFELKKITKKQMIETKLESLNLNQSFVLRTFIKSVWGHYDFYNQRSFDVFLCIAKKKYTEKIFLVKTNVLTRIK